MAQAGEAELLFGCEVVSVYAVCKSAEANDCRLQCSENNDDFAHAHKSQSQ
jgi:hypothetical protein